MPATKREDRMVDMVTRESSSAICIQGINFGLLSEQSQAAACHINPMGDAVSMADETPTCTAKQQQAGNPA
jgi:hypothetical protein